MQRFQTTVFLSILLISKALAESASAELIHEGDVLNDLKSCRDKEFAAAGVDDGVKSAVVVVDMQNDFIATREKIEYISIGGITEEEEGFLKEGTKTKSAEMIHMPTLTNSFNTNFVVVKNVLKLLQKRSSDIFIFSMDDHEPDHISFKHNKEVWTEKLQGELQEAHKTYEDRWGDHCVKKTWGQNIVDELRYSVVLQSKILNGSAFYVLKGTIPDMEGYSAFFKGKGITGRDPMPPLESDAWKTQTSGLYERLKEHGITRIYLCGVAQNICVADTASDARALGFEVLMVDDEDISESASEAIPFSTAYIKMPNETRDMLKEKGVQFKKVSEIPWNFDDSYNPFVSDEEKARLVSETNRAWAGY